MTEVVASSHRRTGVAVLVGLVLFIPGLILGGIAAFLYRAFLGYVLKVFSWLPFYGVIETVTLGWFGGLMHGFVAATVAVEGTLRLFKQANPQAVSYSTAASWLFVLTIILLLDLGTRGISFDMVEAIAFALGVSLQVSVSNRSET